MAKRILIVNDDPFLLKHVVANLRARGNKTVMVGEGRTALDIIDQSPPDLVIMDTKIRDMDSMEMCRKIQEISEVPIVLLSDNPELADKDNLNSLNLRIEDCIVKPFEIEELLASVRTVLQQIKE